MDPIATDHALQEMAAVFRCHPNMAAAIADRIRQRLGRPVSNAEIVRVMKSISPTRLSVDAVIAKLEKQPQRKPRAAAPAAEKPARADKPPARGDKATLQEQLEALLADNWKRAAAEKLSAPNMSVGEFVKAVRSYTGYKDAPLRRILNAAISLDRKDTMLTPHVVADQVNEMAMNGDEN